MSPILFVVLLMAMGIVTMLIILILIFAKKNVLRISLIITALLLFFPIMLALLPLMAKAVTQYRYDILPESVPTLHAPPGAKQVSYRFSPSLGTALVVEFNVSEPEFLAWMKALGWTPTPIEQEEQVMRLSSYANNTQDSLKVTNGYRFDNYHKDKFDDSGTTVIYDRETGMAFVRRTNF